MNPVRTKTIRNEGINESRPWRRAIVQNGIMPKTNVSPDESQRRAAASTSLHADARQPTISYDDLLQELPLCQSGKEKEILKEMINE